MLIDHNTNEDTREVLRESFHGAPANASVFMMLKLQREGIATAAVTALD